MKTRLAGPAPPLSLSLAFVCAVATLLPATATELEERDVVFRNGEVALAGVIRLPAADEPVAGVVIIQGSGTSDRTNHWARAIATELAAAGIAVLLPDKRGSGASGGDWRSADFDDLAADALAAVARLRQEPAVAPERIGLVGLSQGGRIAPLAALRSDSVAFVVSVSGGATPMAETVAWEVEQAWRREIADDGTVERALEFLRQSDRYARDRSGWTTYVEMRAALERDFGPRTVATFPATEDHWYWRWWGGIVDYDPLPYWRQLRRPALLVYGEDDDNAPVAASVGRLERLLREPESADRDLTLKVFADTGHGLRERRGGRLLPEFVELLTRWIHARASAVSGGAEASPPVLPMPPKLEGRSVTPLSQGSQ